jgi:hypothetical protein
MNPKHAVRIVGNWPWRQVIRFSSRATTSRAMSALSLSDQQFLTKFDLPQVSEEVKRGNLKAAQQLLLTHYRNRVAPAWPSFPERFTNAACLNTEELLRGAEDIMENRFSKERISLGKKIDWLYNPTPDPVARWTRDIHRHRWLAVLAIAYEKTGREKYAEKFVDVVLQWIHANPLPCKKSEDNVGWALMNVGIRSMIWVAAFGAFYRSPAFTDNAKLTMLRSIYDHGRFLYRFKTHHNHVLRESIGLMSLGVYFPEFNEADDWIETALARLTYELTEHVNDDGTSVEMSTGYQWLVTKEFDAARALMKEHNLRLPGVDLDDWMAKLYTPLAYVLRPDGIWPRLDDGFIADDAGHRDVLAAAGEEFNRPDFIYIASNGARCEKPAQTSAAFQNAGLYVMRSDWSGDARYLVFDAGQFSGYHGHEDKLGIEVFAYNKPFIVDPGCHSYNVKDPYRVYFASSRAHNTAMVAGKSQIRRWYRPNLNPKRQTQAHGTWISEQGFDYAEGVYRDGYGSYEFQTPRNPIIITGVTHTRRVMFVKPDYWVIIDELDAVSEHHDYEILFNLSPNLRTELTSEHSLCMHAEDNSARLYLVNCGSDPYNISSVNGQTEPIQGWYANGWCGRKVPSTTVMCRIKNVRSTTLATLLYPCRNERVVDLQAQAISEGNALAYRVTSGGWIDYLLFARDNKAKSFGPCRSDAQLAAFRARAGEQPRQLFSWRSSAV